MNNIGPLLILGAVIFIPTLVAGLLAERRRQRRANLAKGDKNRTPTPDATPEFSKFIRQIALADYKDTSLVRPNGKYYGATFGNDFIILRLPLERHEQAIADGGKKTDRNEWIGFHYDWGNPALGTASRQTISQWCRVARDYADQAR